MEMSLGGGTDARAQFIVKTYNHLFGAIVGFCLLELAYFSTGFAETFARLAFSMSWLVILGAFALSGWLASNVAARAESLVAQYAALAVYVVAESLIFVPLLYVADHVAPGAIREAAYVTLAGFAGLTAIAFLSRKDFSFMGATLRWIGLGALMAIVLGVCFGFSLGLWFSVGMVVFAGAAILYDTSNVIRHYPEDRYVGAALQLFASVALLFWYVLRIVMRLSRN